MMNVTRERVSIYDSTLRDGVQGEGVSFSDAGRIRFAHILDELGVDFIEGGFAGANLGDRQFFTTAAKETFGHAKIVAFGSTRRADEEIGRAPMVKALLEAETEYVSVYGKAWTLHVRDVLHTTPANNLQMVADTVGYLSSRGRKVFFDAEHFFDGYREDAGYAMRVLETALREGAAGLVLCDTNGGSMPDEIFETTRAVCARFPDALVSIHAHNDMEMAVACSLMAVRGGARQVQGCMNGYGERTGNANLVSIIPALTCKLGHSCIGEGQLKNLRKVSYLVADLVNLRPDPAAPYVGDDAFSHKAGAHVNGVLKNPRTFEHIDPAVVGNKRHLLVSELAGSAGVRQKASELGIDTAALGTDTIRSLLQEVKQREKIGYAYESADGSFKILVEKMLKHHAPAFELEGFRVIVEKRGREVPCVSEATIKVKVNGQTELTAGEGHGPVDALNEAMRKALTRFYPEIRDVALKDFRVRILDPDQATRALTRVLIESGDRQQQWGTVGVSENIIEASWQALLDSVEYKLLSKAKPENGERA